MPRNRWTPTRSQKSEYSRAVERMRAAGAELAPFTFDCPWVRVTHCLAAGCVRTWTGASVFVIHVRMVGLAPKIVLQGFDLSSPEWEFNAYILDDPAEGNSSQQFYRTLDGSRFHRSEVLNHRVDADGVLRRGDVMEGLVLGECFSSVPTLYNQWNSMPLTVSVVNQFDEVHESKFAIQVEQIRDRIKPRAARRSTLYDGADGSPGHPGSPVDAPDAVLPSRQPPERPVDRNRDRWTQAEEPSQKAPAARPAGGD